MVLQLRSFYCYEDHSLSCLKEEYMHPIQDMEVCNTAQIISGHWDQQGQSKTCASRVIESNLGSGHKGDPLMESQG